MIPQQFITEWAEFAPWQASFRYAFLMSAVVAVLSTPNIL
jgi:hypothetical protein